MDSTLAASPGRAAPSPAFGGAPSPYRGPQGGRTGPPIARHRTCPGRRYRRSNTEIAKTRSQRACEPIPRPRQGPTLTGSALAAPRPCYGPLQGLPWGPRPPYPLLQACWSRCSKLANLSSSCFNLASSPRLPSSRTAKYPNHPSKTTTRATAA